MQDREILAEFLIPVTDTLFFLAVFAAIVIFAAFLARLILGKDSGLKHALVCSIGIIVLYALCVVVYTFDPAGLKQYLVPLPFVSIEGDQMTLFRFVGTDLPAMSAQLLSMILLAYLVNQINSFTPDKLKPMGFLIYRSFCTIAAFFSHYIVHRIIQRLEERFMPDLLTQYGPMILLGILVFLFLLGFFKFLVGLVVTVANPLFGGIYTFFFANRIGKNLSRALGTTVVLTAFVDVLHKLEYHTLPIAPEHLDRYIPFLVCVSLIWIIVGNKM